MSFLTTNIFLTEYKDSSIYLTSRLITFCYTIQSYRYSTLALLCSALSVYANTHSVYKPSRRYKMNAVEI